VKSDDMSRVPMEEPPGQTSGLHPKRRTWIVNRRLQIRYTLLIVIVTAGLYGALGSLVYQQLSIQDEMNLNLQGVQAMLLARDPSPEAMAYLNAAAAFVHGEQMTSVGVLFGALFVLVALLSAGGIYITHHIAGPIHAIDQHLRDVAAGRWRRMHKLRRGDEFVFLSRHVDGLVDSLVARERAELAALDQLQGSLAEIPADARAALEALVQAKRARLRVADEAPPA